LTEALAGDADCVPSHRALMRERSARVKLISTDDRPDRIHPVVEPRDDDVIDLNRGGEGPQVTDRETDRRLRLVGVVRRETRLELGMKRLRRQMDECAQVDITDEVHPGTTRVDHRLRVNALPAQTYHPIVSQL